MIYSDIALGSGQKQSHKFLDGRVGNIFEWWMASCIYLYKEFLNRDKSMVGHGIIVNAYLRGDDVADNVSETKADVGSDEIWLQSYIMRQTLSWPTPLYNQVENITSVTLSVSQHSKQRYISKKKDKPQRAHQAHDELHRCSRRKKVKRIKMGKICLWGTLIYFGLICKMPLVKRAKCLACFSCEVASDQEEIKLQIDHSKKSKEVQLGKQITGVSSPA